LRHGWPRGEGKWQDAYSASGAARNVDRTYCQIAGRVGRIKLKNAVTVGGKRPPIHHGRSMHRRQGLRPSRQSRCEFPRRSTWLPICVDEAGQRPSVQVASQSGLPMPGADVMRVKAVNQCKLYGQLSRATGHRYVRPTERRHAATEVDVEVPGPDEEWSIGLIVGSSGTESPRSPSTRLATRSIANKPWPANRAMIDCLGDHPSSKSPERSHHRLQQPAKLDQAVPRAQHRRAVSRESGSRILCDRPLVVFDEFSGSVCRAVAKTSSIAIAKAIRSRRLDKRFVAVTCHDDVRQWLESDWY